MASDEAYQASWNYINLKHADERFHYFKESSVNNLEFMNRYERMRTNGVLSVTDEQLAKIIKHGKLGILDMTNEQLLEMQVEIPALIENLRIALQQVEHVRRSRGADVRLRLKDADLEYIVPAQTQLEKIEKKMSKSGASEAEIARIKQAADIDFSDI